ncbi:peptidase M10, partial [Nocardioides sp. Y6]
SIFFDVAHYKARYADIAGASNQDAMKHFTEFGMNEGRQGSAEFGPAYYMGTNPDLQQAYGANNYRRGIPHWIARGRAEGRPGAP